MARLLLVGDIHPLNGLGSVFRQAGYRVVSVCSVQTALEATNDGHPDAVVIHVSAGRLQMFQLLQDLHSRHCALPIIVAGVATIREAVAAIRLGATEIVETPIGHENLIRSVAAALNGITADAALLPRAEGRLIDEAHAAARWARALVPLMISEKDPRTITGWSRIVFASPGALRNWCRTAGISARRSLVLARLLRVAHLSQAGRHRPEDLLDIVDRRTLVGLLKCAGLNPDAPFPKDAVEFLQRQTIVRDPDRLHEIDRAIAGLQRTLRFEPRASMARAVFTETRGQQRFSPSSSRAESYTGGIGRKQRQ